MHNELDAPRYQASMYGKGVLFYRPFDERNLGFLISVETLCEFYQHGANWIATENDVLNLFNKYSHLINAAADAQLALYQILIDQKKMSKIPDISVVLEVMISRQKGRNMLA